MENLQNFFTDSLTVIKHRTSDKSSKFLEKL